MDKININVPAPEIGPYTKLTPFRFWCQKVLPLVYDESLSYYELLCKVIDYLNKTMEDVDQVIEDMGEYKQAFIDFTTEVKTAVEDLETFVNTYFDNLDVQEEINNKLDAMAEAGYFDTLFNTLFRSDIINKAGEVTSAWIAENLLQETGYVIDKTLTVSDAAADAEITGKRLEQIYNSHYEGENENAGNVWESYLIVEGHTYKVKKITAEGAIVFHTTAAIGSYDYIDTVNSGSPITVANKEYSFTATASTNAIIVYANTNGAQWEIYDVDDFANENDKISYNAYNIKDKTISIQNLAIGLNAGEILNPLKYTWEKGGLIQSTGGLWEDGVYSARVADFIECPCDMSLITTNKTATNPVNIYIYDSNKDFIGQYSVPYSSDRTFDLAKGNYYKFMVQGDISHPVSLTNINSFIEVKYENKNTLKLPDYYNSYMAGKLETIKEKSAYISGVTFPFITDVHLQFNAFNSGKLIKLIDEKTNAVPFVVFGGDVPKAIDTSTNVMMYADKWNEYMSTWGKHKTIQVHGNHDYMCALDDSLENLWFAPLSTVFEYVQQNNYFMLDRPPCVLYGALDVPGQKVKIIFADNYDGTYDFENDTWTGGALMSNDQLKWIAETVLNAEDYHILFVSHVPTLTSMSVAAEAAALKPFDDLIKAAKNKTSYTVDDVTFDFSSWTGDVIGELAGHMHKDASGTSDNVLYIGVTCDSFSDADPDVTRTQGTTSEQAFDVVCIDTYNKTINLVRIGGGSDRNFTY